jgi:hypothetical protein
MVARPKRPQPKILLSVLFTCHIWRVRGLGGVVVHRVWNWI